MPARGWLLERKPRLSCQLWRSRRWPVPASSSMVWHGVFSRAFFLRATYQKAMDKAWKALAASVHEDGFIGYNQGTGKDRQPVSLSPSPLSQTSRTTAQVASCSVLQSITSF